MYSLDESGLNHLKDNIFFTVKIEYAWNLLAVVLLANKRKKKIEIEN